MLAGLQTSQQLESELSRVAQTESEPCHTALDLAVPASRYTPSQVSFPAKLPDPDYNTADQVRRIGEDGYTSFKGHKLKLSQAFKGLNVAFRPTSVEGLYNAVFMRFTVAKLDLRHGETHITTVRDVSEHPSAMSPV